MYDLKECIDCGFYDIDMGCCTCPSYDAWYACPIESVKPENIKALKEYAEWCDHTHVILKDRDYTAQEF